MILGTLGRKVWHRCDCCGMEFADGDSCPACAHVDVEEDWHFNWGHAPGDLDPDFYCLTCRQPHEDCACPGCMYP